MMNNRERVTFTVGDEQLVGHLFRPADTANTVKKAPALILTGPYTGVKEQVTGIYAKRLAEAGFVTLAFDHRNFGESAGFIRQHEEPQKKLDDLATATAFVSALDNVDEQQIGAVGICLGGSYALRFAGFDPRIKALANVAAAYIGFPAASAEESAGKAEWLSGYADELNLLAQGTPSRTPAVSEDPTLEVGMPGQEPFDYYGTARSYSPHWKNEISKLSSYNLAGFDAIAATQLLQKTPTLVVHGTTDAFCSPESAQRAYDLIAGEKHLHWIETSNHIELYDNEAQVLEAVQSIADWMHKHLKA